MKRIILNTVISLLLIVTCAVGVYLLQKAASNQAALRKADAEAISSAGAASGKQIEFEEPQAYHPVSIGLFVVILVIQCIALFTASHVINNIKNENAPMAVKMKKLENADIFIDLPLYVGLFGTVSSFIIIAFNPMASRLIAYSSTLIGIIISVILRTILLYPLKQELLNSKNPMAAENLNGVEKQ